MASFTHAMRITCAVEKAPPTTPLQHLTSTLNSAFKPLLKKTNQLPLKTQFTESIKAACVTMLDAFVDSTFKFVDTPAELPGNYAPVDEIDEAIMLSDIEGEIPKDFPQGIYMRTGPNFLHPTKLATESMFGRAAFGVFQGDGMVHATFFDRDDNGKWKLSYRNRYAEAETFLMEKERDKPLLLPAAEGEPRALLIASILNMLRFGKVTKDYNNTNVFENAGKVYTISENHLPYEIDKSNLKTGKIWDVNGAWDRPFTSHPKRAPGTGEVVIMGVNAVKPYYVVGVISADGEKLLNKVDVKFGTPTLSHEIGITENYNIILDYPIRFGLSRLLADKQLIGYERDDGQRSRIGVMPRYGDAESIKWFGVKNHCSYHIIDSFEDGDEVIVRVCWMSGSLISGPSHKDDKAQWYRRAFSQPPKKL
ncbi:hypothetical protein QJS10_CPB18g01070 [Acorus calamus]|uniref:Uncharacterized protein n=1 Tax=Acorus calamus TaxID=4465 RepID=A0AAV9CLH5_ACOCL|nr:hypothetical protein QJS10_CPB18g01070 [Acorus calamus]